MNVEIINVGTELLLGEIVNTNATYLQKMCRDLGFNVYFQTVVGDNIERLYDCLKLAFERGANCVITTGGLGPTTDDLTKELSAKYLGLKMEYNEEEAIKVNEKCCYITGLDHVSDNNFKQAYFPKDAYILENLMGTANGCVMSKGDKIIINLPGPPKELKYVVEHSLVPFLTQYKQETIYTFDYITMFIGESKIDDILSDMINQQTQVSIALYAGEETVRVRLAVKAKSLSEANELMAPIQKEIKQRIGQYIINHADLKEALLQMKHTISIEYLHDFHFQDDFLKPILSSHPDVCIKVSQRQEKLGEVIGFSFNDDYYFEVPTFLKAEFSLSKIEARFVAQLYQYMIKTL